MGLNQYNGKPNWDCAADVPNDAMIRRVGSRVYEYIEGANEEGVMTGGPQLFFMFDRDIGGCEYSLDGNEWRYCTK